MWPMFRAVPMNNNDFRKDMHLPITSPARR